MDKSIIITTLSHELSRVIMSCHKTETAFLIYIHVTI